MITRRQSLTGMATLGAATLGLAGCSSLRPGGGGGGGSDGGSDGGSNTLVLGHAGSETDPRQKGSEQIKELIEECSDGRITVEIHANSTLGSWEQMIEGLQLGTTHIVIESILALEAYTDLAGVETAPFLYESDEQFFGVWDGELGAEIKASLTEPDRELRGRDPRRAPGPDHPHSVHADHGRHLADARRPSRGDALG